MTDVRALLAATTLVVRSGPFVMAGWPRAAARELAPGVLAAAEPWALMEDDREVTALVREDTLAGLPAPVHREAGWALLTLDAVMAWDVVGVLAEVTRELADAGVSVGAFTAYSRDHVLVPGPQLDQALEVLGPLFAEVDCRP